MFKIIALPVLIAAGFLAQSAQADSQKEDFASDRAVVLCEAEIDGCAETIAGAVGVLSFPDVTEVTIGVGGEGGHGVLFENGLVEGEYELKAVSAGLEVGMERMSVLFVLNTEEAVTRVKDGEWMVGADLSVALGGAKNDTASSGTDVTAYVFDGEGAQIQASVDVLRVAPVSG